MPVCWPSGSLITQVTTRSPWAQLARLGFPRPLAEAVADHVDWHEIAALVHRGCRPRLALNIVL